MNKKKAIYLRKSRGEIKDLEKHKSQLLKICKNNSWEYDIYEEIASSEKFEERFELTNLIENIEKYDGVVCIHIDRLSRNELHQALLTQIFKEHNVKVITINKEYDFTKENDILLGDFEKLIARQELRLTKARLKRGKLAAFEKGFWVNGFPPMPYVYNRESKSLDVDKDKLLEFNNLKNLALKGYSCNEIANEMKYSHTKVKRILKSKVHLGYTKYNGLYKIGLHKAVISKEEYEKINELIDIRKRGETRVKHIYTFSNLILCKCGHTRTLTNFNKKEAILKCRYCKDPGFVLDGLLEEVKKKISENNNKLMVYINEMGKNDKKLELQDKINKLELESKKINKKIDNIRNLLIEDLMEFTKGKETIVCLKNQELIVRCEIENLKKKINYSNNEKNSIIENSKEIFRFLDDIKMKERNLLYSKLIKVIIIENKTFRKIVWK
ncbi:MAG: recombinase family protein [Sarcina sp.]